MLLPRLQHHWRARTGPGLLQALPGTDDESSRGNLHFKTGFRPRAVNFGRIFSYLGALLSCFQAGVFIFASIRQHDGRP